MSESFGEVERLRSELDAERRELAAAYDELRRREELLGDVNVQAAAKRVAAAENRRADAEFKLESLRVRRGVRLGLALAESASRSSVGGVASQVRDALVRREFPVRGDVVRAEHVMAQLSGSVSLSPRLVDPVYANARVVHFGQVQTFGGVAEHVPLAVGSELVEQASDGADMFLIEPSVLARGDGAELTSVVSVFKEAGVPVVLFGRVEVHLDLPFVGDVDVVVVDDPVMAGLARDTVGDDRVLELLPSVDATVFNPIDWQRDPDGAVGLFVSYPPRRLDLSGDRWLFDAAGDDLDVWVSNASALPVWLQQRVRGEIGSLARQAKGYRVAVESVSLHGSEGEYVRRVLELVALGTPVVTTGSPLLGAVGGSDLVHVVSNSDEARGALDSLASDSLYRERVSIEARRAVLALHTRRQRFEDLLVRLDSPVKPPERVSIVFSTNRPEYLEHAYDNLRSQDWVNKELITVLHNDQFDLGEVDRLNQTLDFPVTVIQAPGHWNLGDCYNAAVDAATGDLITKWDDDDYYGENHITDLILARRYSQADIVGKMVEFVYLADRDITVARETGGTERMNNHHVAGGTMMMSRHLARTLRFDRRRRWVDAGILSRARHAGCTIYATHPFGYMLNRHGRGHTWESGSTEFLNAERTRLPGRQPDLAGVRPGPDIRSRSNR